MKLDTPNKPKETKVEMHKRETTMADGKRHIIYYTFSGSLSSD